MHEEARPPALRQEGGNGAHAEQEGKLEARREGGRELGGREKGGEEE